MPSEQILAVEGLSKRFRVYEKPQHRLAEWFSAGRLRRHREHWAVREVGFSLNAGETFGIMGRNGAGKTTLLALLAGLLKPTSGDIRRPASVASLINLGAGFDPEADGTENVRRIAAMLDGEALDAAGIAAVADFAELGEAMDRPFRTYSAGMQLRLAFACATRRRPDLLIIDEVMAVGDFFFRRKCHARIQDFVAQGTAAVLVSHDYTEIMQFCRRALVLDGGTIAYLGDAATAVNRYLLSRHAHSASGVVASGDDGDRRDDTDALAWPSVVEQADLSGVAQPGLGLELAAFACCDRMMVQRHVFEQGEVVSLFVAVTAREATEVPVVAVQISDDHGVLVHGTSTYMRGDQPSRRLRAGESMRIRFDIGLGLRYGEYLVDLAVGDVAKEVFDGRGAMGFEEFGCAVRQRGRFGRMAVIAVVPRQGGRPTQLTHHGVCDLPGSTSFSFCTSAP